MGENERAHVQHTHNKTSCDTLAGMDVCTEEFKVPL